MVQDLWRESQSVRELFAQASEETDLDCEHILFEGTDEELKKTENTQVAVTLANLSSMLFLEEHGVTSDLCAGFSLGEYSALVDSGVLDQKGIFKIVRRRGEIMARASGQASAGIEAGPAGMAAVLGLDMDEAEPVLAALSAEDVYLANHSSPTQIVLAGSSDALDKADRLFEEAGALKFVRLKVSGPFHSPLMEQARLELSDYLRDVDFRDPTKPIFANVTGDRIPDGESARKLCSAQIVSPVRWVSSEEQIMALSCDQVIEAGPGKVLAGLWKSFTKKTRCQPAGTVDEIRSLANAEQTDNT
jgi:[acyl-carrier-protein] S-malonyltransferase